MQKLNQYFEQLEYIKEMKQKLEDGKLNTSKYVLVDGLLYYKKRILLDHNCKEIIQIILLEYHSAP